MKLHIIDYILNVTILMYFMSTLVREITITEKTDGSSSVAFGPVYSKKVKGSIPTAATPADCE